MTEIFSPSAWNSVHLCSAEFPSLTCDPMSFFRHLGRLLSDVVGFARQNKAWWMVPLVVLLLVIGGLIVGVSTISPFIYSLF